MDSDETSDQPASPRSVLAQRIRDLIRQEQLNPGEHLGSERGLAERLGVGRSPLRGALELLETSREIRRTMGRLGGIVISDGKITRPLNTIQGVPDMLRRHGLGHATRLLRVEVGAPTREESRLLRLTEQDPVVRIRRRRDAADVPLSLDAMSLPARSVPGWARLDFSESVYQILRREYGIEPALAAESVDLSFATEAQAEILNVELGAPLFEIRRLTFNREERPIELSRDLFRADRTRISMERVGQSWKRTVRDAR